MDRRWMLLGLVGLAGCLPLTEERTTLVGSNPFGETVNPAAVTRASYAPGSKDVALRVDQAGQKLLANSPQLGFKPLFATIGSPRLELFHAEAAAMGDKDKFSAAPVIYITEGLVKRCSGEIELAAVLSFELARISAAREAKVSPEIRQPEKLPPISVPIGIGGGPSAAGDQVALAELAKFEKRHPKTPKVVPPPDPRKLATAILDRAGYPVNALETVQPILNEADQNAALERQIKGGAPRWMPE